MEVALFDNNFNMATEDEVFEVEEIRDRGVGDDGKALYLVKWKGYDSSENTWEPEKNLVFPFIDFFCILGVFFVTEITFFSANMH